MSREPEGYREELARLTDAFPGRDWIKTEEIAQRAGVCRRTARKKFGITNGGLSVHAYAMALCKANKNAAQRSSAVRR